MFLIQRLINTRLSLIVSWWGSVFRLRFVHQLAVDFDPADEEQTAFEACAGLAFLLAFIISESISPDVADSEGDEHLLFSFNGLLAAFNQRFCLGTDNVAVDVGVLGFISCTVQSCNGDTGEGFALAGTDFTDTVEVADASGMQVEEFGFVGLIAHCGSPVSIAKAEKHFAQVGKVFPAWVRWYCKLGGLPSIRKLTNRSTGSLAILG